MLEQKPIELTEDTLSKISRPHRDAKSAITDKTVKRILHTEKVAVDAKTERLKAARLERDSKGLGSLKVSRRAKKAEKN
ncbi:hypothetical protein HGG72_16840 [Ochrobactrum pecoris]|uniref:Uncharacterized protein n=1 Tax=Brucella pecoris TaxID=867683 RepID=A0A5C5CH56_9HYPH|nr:hypothetical protein [Brucella pecoris]MBB4095286.1 hypothetical protein [Brucella pecoris]NKW81594.1 hypothetical protein [Brucella pecoris]TNV10498.1 hypothetical protein FIB18_16130 [Brucella pecoris]